MSGYCVPVIGNVMVYRDNDRLTSTFLRTMVPVVQSEARTGTWVGVVGLSLLPGSAESRPEPKVPSSVLSDNLDRRVPARLGRTGNIQE